MYIRAFLDVLSAGRAARRVYLSVALTGAVCLVPATVWAAVYQVGAGKPYTSLKQVPVLRPGDVVEIFPGVYHEAWRLAASGTPSQPITIRGTGVTRPIIDGTGVKVSGWLPQTRALFQVEGDHYIIENLEFRNARNSTANGGGIRILGATGVTIRRCRITYNDMGIQSTQADALLIETSEIAYNGRLAPYIVTHNVYVGTDTRRATFRYCYIHDAVSGQNLKSRAHYTEVLFSYIADSNEGELVLVDSTATEAPESNALVAGNVIVSRANRTGNLTKFIEFGQDRADTHRGTLYLFNNTLVAGSSWIQFLRLSSAQVYAVANNNVFAGSDHIVKFGSERVSGAGNWLHDTAERPAGFFASLQTRTVGFVDRAARNFRLSATSPAINAAAGDLAFRDGAGVPGVAALRNEYVEHTSSRARASDGLVDIGAFEFAGNGVPVARLSVRPGTGTAPLTVAFDGSASTDADGLIVRYHWVFGDGTVASGTSPTAVRTYTKPGAYTAIMTVTDSGGRTASSSATIAVAAPQLVVAPPASLNWGIGSTQDIAWTHNLGPMATFRLEVSRDGGATFAQIAAAIPASPSPVTKYVWKVTAPATTAARFRVTATDGRARAVSTTNLRFAAPYIAVATPTGATDWGYGTERNQAWTTNLGPYDRVSIFLSKDGGVTFPLKLAGDVAADRHTAIITVPTLAAATNRARVRIAWDSAPTSVSGVNPREFTVRPAWIQLTSPNGGEVWSVGSNVTITWLANLDNLETVKVQLSTDGGVTWPVTLTTGANELGALAVRVQRGWISAKARIRITWNETTTVTDKSAAVFAIR